MFAAKQAVAEGSLSARNAFATAAEVAAAEAATADRRDVILNENGEPVEEPAEVWLWCGADLHDSA